AGGLKVEDPSIDLAVLSALLSSYEDVALPLHICFAGEVGLSGEIRAVNRIEQRIAEAEKLGFEKIIVSKYNQKGLSKQKTKIEFNIAKDNIIQKLIHELKYKGNKEIGFYLGEIMGRALAGANHFKGIDALIPLPLFADKEFKRGYNQATVLCEGISATMQI